MEKLGGSGGDFLNGGEESGFVGFGWLVEAGDFADELEGSGADLVGSDRRFEIEKRFDAAAHGAPAKDRVRGRLRIANIRGKHWQEWKKLRQ